MANLFEAKRWLLHHNKRPHYITGDLRTGNLENDADKLGTYEEAVQAAEKHGYGLGFALGRDDSGGYWQGIDFDHISEHPENEHKVIALLGATYCEKSPSGDGIHAIGYGEPFPSKGSGKDGIEAYCQGRFFTFTGDSLNSAPVADISELVPYVLGRPLQALVGPSTVVSEAFYEELSADMCERVKGALTYLDADDYGTWIKYGMALKRHGEEGHDLWMEWSSTSPLYNEQEAIRKWHTFTPQDITVGSILYDAKLLGYKHINHKTNALRITDYEEQSSVEELIDGCIEGGIGNIAANMAVGKTQSLISLCAVITGEVTDTHLVARPHRKVLYVVENVIQAHRIYNKLMDMVGTPKEGWFNIASSHRSSIDEIRDYVQLAMETLTVLHENGERILPLIVIDTSNANFDLESENDSSQVGSLIAAIKECGGHCWIVSHTPKSALKEGQTARGSSAWGSDVDWTASMSRAENSNIAVLHTHKVRLTENCIINFMGYVEYEEVEDRYGYARTIKKPWSIIVDAYDGQSVGTTTDKYKTAVYQFIKDNPGCTSYAIKTALKINGMRVKVALTNLGPAITAGPKYSTTS